MRDIATSGRGMQPPFAAQGEFETLDRIGDVALRPLKARQCQRVVENLSGRANERAAKPIFLIAGLFPDQHDCRLRRSFTWHDLVGKTIRRWRVGFTEFVI